MSFFKGLFGKKETPSPQPQANPAAAPKAEEKQDPADTAADNPSQEKPNFEGIQSEEYFEKRYSPSPIEDAVLDGCEKMVDSYFIDMKVERDQNYPAHHPKTLDAAVDEGLGFEMYCKAFEMDRGKSALFLAMLFSDYLIKTFGFELYADSQPEYPLRGMTLKYNRDGAMLSLYPFEYSIKVLDYAATYQEMVQRLAANIEALPAMKKQVDDFIKGDDTPSAN